MGTRIIIARHGNTFDRGQTPVRVGLKTDIPLASIGVEQAVILGKYMKMFEIKPAIVFSGELRRTFETANIALRESGVNCAVEKLDIFNEVDYGEDEGKTEEELVERIGIEALELWNSSAIIPKGWIFDTKVAIANWQRFATMVEEKYLGKTVMVFTSNGIARFAPYITGDFEKFSKEFNIKMSTGALSIFEKVSGEQSWNVIEWNLKPKDHVTL
ncbi:MAG: phosphoglycerate mutase family protein [Rickettsiales bacterium]|nr:phosphoglycerate mutase family protein [Rickettsiales bacterium]